MTSERRNPEGWWTLPVEVVTNGSFVMLIGDPPDEEDDPDCVAHHCDTNGCRWSHVLLSHLMKDYERQGLWHLIKAEMEREKAGVGPKPLSLREQMIARKGLTKYREDD